MKNHVVKFSKFINEMAKGDYFRAGKGDIYGLHKDGGNDWMTPPFEPALDPDEELDIDDFSNKYGQELESPGFERYRKELAPGTRVKVWKGLGDRESARKMSRASIERMTTRELGKVVQTLKSNLEDAQDSSADSSSLQKLRSLLSELNAELMRRKDANLD